jgi:hypothetical protein
MARTRLRLRAVAACLLLGLITSVLVAWWFATFARLTVMEEWHDQRTFVRGEHPPRQYTRVRARGFDLIQSSPFVAELTDQMFQSVRLPPWVLTQPKNAPYPRGMVLVPLVRLESPPPLPAWMPTTDPSQWRSYNIAHASGWPLPCVSGSVVADLARRPTHYTGVWRLRASVAKDEFDGTLPITPVWGGLLIDTAIFAALWAVPLALVPMAARRALGAWRRTESRCPSCGYSRTGLSPSALCPECGEALGVVAAEPDCGTGAPHSGHGEPGGSATGS